MRRDLGAEVRPEVDIVALTQRWDSACGKEQRADKTLAEARLEKGRVLVEARKAFPARGPRAKGWGELLARWRVDDATARRYMALAGYVEAEGFAQSERNVPTYAEAGIVSKQPPTTRAAERAPTDDDQPAPPRSNVERLPVWTDEQRAEVVRREVEAGQPPRMEVRVTRTHELIEIARDMRALACRLQERGVHLTDVTTSPEDFMHAKQMLIDVVNRCLDELAQAGVLDGKEQRRQMQLLDGGKR